MRRKTRHDYRQPGSFERIEEAALALADADADDDLSWHRARARLRNAVILFRFATPPRHRPVPPEQAPLPWKHGARTVPK